MPVKLFSAFLFIAVFFFGHAYGQLAAKDSVARLPEHHPKKATIFSAVLPGLGQAYNKKYWKIPILYGGFAAMGYFIKTNNDQYNVYQNAVKHFIDNPSLKTYTVENRDYSLDNILIIKNGYRRNRDLSIIFTVLIYVMNILDANVDAHLFYFNVNDNLSLHLQPAMIPTNTTGSGITGLNLTMNFK